MPIEMPRGLPFSVDTWTPASKKKRHHFLTHAHRDHCSGISSHFTSPIYSTHLTKTLVLQHCSQLDDSLFRVIEVGQSLIIDDSDGAFTVTAFDANHCPGAVMFLFEGKFGNILHTGDCRLTPECLRNLSDKYTGNKGKQPQCPLDCIFLDCTFGNFPQGMPSKHSAIQQEDILVDVSQTFCAKIYVDKAKNPECFKTLELTVPEILCEDPSSRFHVFDGFPRIYERAKAKLAEAQTNLQPEPLIVRASAQWYACEEGLTEMENKRKKRMHEAVKDQFGVWHVCYSMHSDKEELEWALQLLAPRWVVSTTPTCRAVQLNYVKKHCFNSNVALNNTVRKLLDMTEETSSEADLLIHSVSCPPAIEGNPQPRTQSQSPVKQFTDSKELVEVSLPSKRLPVTLFGRARLGLHQDVSLQGGRTISPMNDMPQTVSSDARHEQLNPQKGAELRWENSMEDKKDLDSDKNHQSEDQEPTVCKSASYLNIGSSGYSEGFRKLYRSMNVPVPKRLPSLVELMKSTKRIKRRCDY